VSAAARLVSPPLVRFVGPKLPAPIRVRSFLHWHALVQSSLDPAVEAVGFVGSTHFQGKSAALNATTITRDRRTYYLDLVEDRELRDVDSEGLFLLALQGLGLAPLEKTAADILSEPLYANCEIIWRHRRDRVAADAQFDVIRILQEDGPQPLGRLAPLAGVVESTILTMACHDLVEIDIHDAPLNSRTMIRRRDRFRLSPPPVAPSL
jgi:hypothetical protein